MLKSLPIGVANYEELQIKDYYVVDKTLMIEEFLQRKSKVTLITRPRRFGKTSNMSMMSEFFDTTKDSKEIFKNTKISKTEYYHEMNQYPTIFLSFANCKGDNVKQMQDSLVENILKMYEAYETKFDQLQENPGLVHRIKKIYKALQEGNDFSVFASSIQTLSEFLYKLDGKKVMIFIDEYDTPFIEAHVKGYYDDIKSNLASLLQRALKDNNSLEYAMLTGIQRVSKENVFSHLNNLKVFTVKDKGYAQYFGFTTEETKQLLAYYDLEFNASVKEMYNGYNMGGIEIYNPWSIINYADQKELVSYWVNTSSNTMLKEAMKACDVSFKSDFEKLIQDGYLEVETNLATSFYEVRNKSNLWGLFVNAGYLTIDQVFRVDRVRLRIPNYEVREEFANLTAYHLGVEGSALNEMYAALEDKRAEDFLRQYRFTLMDLPSYHDLKGENSYHMMMLGMCAVLRNDYNILSNREVGNGRCDIILKSKSKELPSYVIEFKYTKEETDLTQLAMQAIEQIKLRQYDFNLEGEVIYVGLAHHGKEVEMVWNSQQ